MAQNITLLGASYSAVPSVTLPKTGGGIATFTDTSDADATASDILSGKTAYVNGEKITGTGSGGGGSGLEYETGTYTPSSDIARPTITFSKTHSKLPVFAEMIDADGYISTSNSNIIWYYVNWEQLIGGAVYVSTSSLRYGEVRYSYRGTKASSLSASSGMVFFSESNTDDTSNAYPRFSVNESWMMPYSGSDSRYWITGRTYKWIAVWAPTT